MLLLLWKLIHFFYSSKLTGHTRNGNTQTIWLLRRWGGFRKDRGWSRSYYRCLWRVRISQQDRKCCCLLEWKFCSGTTDHRLLPGCIDPIPRLCWLLYVLYSLLGPVWWTINPKAILPQTCRGGQTIHPDRHPLFPPRVRHFIMQMSIISGVITSWACVINQHSSAADIEPFPAYSC